MDFWLLCFTTEKMGISGLYSHFNSGMLVFCLTKLSDRNSEDWDIILDLKESKCVQTVETNGE